MSGKRKPLIKIASLLLAAAAAFTSFAARPEPVCASELEEGTYEISGSLSAYLSAMGGVEFGGPLLTGVYFIVGRDGSEYIKITLGKSSVTIYSITCDTFVDVSPTDTTNTRGVENGTLGIYDSDGNLVSCSAYTLSTDTALNSADEEVNYVDSITFPIDSRESSYNLAIYVNSNVMGVEFCNSNSAATETTYPATLTVDWSAVDALETAEDSEEETSSAGTETTQETSEETTVTADEELEGLAIYNAGSEEETSASSSDTEEEAGDASASDTSLLIVVIAASVIVAAVIIIIVLVLNKKAKGKRKASPNPVPEGNSSGRKEDITAQGKAAEASDNPSGSKGKE